MSGIAGAWPQLGSPVNGLVLSHNRRRLGQKSRMKSPTIVATLVKVEARRPKITGSSSDGPTPYSSFSVLVELRAVKMASPPGGNNRAQTNVTPTQSTKCRRREVMGTLLPKSGVSHAHYD